MPDYGIAPPAFRLPEETHVGSVRLQVSDIGRSIAYYEQVLGLRLYTRTPDTASLGPHGEQRPLLTLESRSGVVPARKGAIGLFHFAILLPQREALGRFVTHVAALRVRVGMADHLVSEAVYLTDPDGLGIEVYADRPPSSWRHRDRELLMTTDPLDVNDLVAAGGRQPWTGMPAGTTIGHVHLHVGNLDEAEGFYHLALGLDKMVWSYPGALFLAAGGYHHHLGTNVWSAEAPARPEEARLLDWELVVPSGSVAAVARNLITRGCVVEQTAGECVVHDPWGTRLRVRDVNSSFDPGPN